MYHLGQVKMSCRVIEGYQEDAGVVTITEDEAVSDFDEYLDFAAGLKLEVNSVGLRQLLKNALKTRTHMKQRLILIRA